MRISQLETFAAVARYRNFTKASQACYLVQSTISHQISSLEDELGFTLFERDSHNVTLTHAGEQFYRDVAEPLEILRQAVRRAQSVAAGKTGSLSIGVSGVNQNQRLNRVLSFRDSNPGVSLSYSRVGNSNATQKLSDGAFDIALISIPEGLAPEFEVADIRNERLYIVAAHSHPLSTFSRISLRDAFTYPLMFARNGDLTEEENRWDILRTFGVEGADLQNIILTEDMDIMQLMLESGEAAAPVPESVMYYEQKTLAVVELIDPPPPIHIGWIFRTDNPNPVLHQFVTYLSENH
jgi:DNA-binding transcriptional LysR family regulator